MTVRASKPRQSCHSVHPGIRQPPQGPASSLILHSSLGPGRWHVPCSTTAGRRGHGEGICRGVEDSRGGGSAPDGGPPETGGGRGARRPRGEILLDYRMPRGDSRWQVYDVLIDGVSFVSTYRSQFDRVIQAESYGALVERLRKRNLDTAVVDRKKL